MSFVKLKDFVEEGDRVILYFSINSIHAIEVCATMTGKHGHQIENKFQSTYGVMRVMDLVGKKYGTKINFPNGYGYLLHPTCELWTKAMPHRTQIIYTPDISNILLGLDLKPGCIVYEAGTGSGSLSHAIVRAIQPTGHLYTYDFHEQRAKLARDDFEKHGITQWVSVNQRDVISDGFPKPEKVDAIFLDLPNPWEAVSHLTRSLKRGGKVCTFSPCIEQVQKTCEALKKARAFVNISTEEILQRPFTVQTKSLNSIDFTRIEHVKGVNLEPINRNAIKFRTFIPPSIVPGHTGYLTFATFVSLPVVIPQTDTLGHTAGQEVDTTI